MFELCAGELMIEIAPEHGGRINRFVVDGNDLMVSGTGEENPLHWGSYPMVPWAGRVRDGLFSHDGSTYELFPRDMPPHAIHGTGYVRPWERIGESSLAYEHGPGWPLGGKSVQHFALTPRSLTCVLEVHAADRPMPGMLGWHPWFLKPDSLKFSAGRMYQRDEANVPTGVCVAVPPGPWDDSFGDVTQPIELRWGDIVLSLTSTCEYWIVYDEPDHATCVEPQSSPSNAFEFAPEIIFPGRPMIHTFTLSVLSV